MRIAILMNKSEYSSGRNDQVNILGMEIVDPTKHEDGDTIIFTDEVSGTEYIKVIRDVPEDAYKSHMISNFDCFVYKRSTGSLVVVNTNMTGRKLETIDTSVPVITDQYLVPFVVS